MLALSLLGTLAVFCPLAYGIYRANHAYAHFGPVAATFWSRPWYLLSLLALFTFSILTLYRIRIARRFVAVHKNGLRLGLSHTKILSWEQIAGISTAITQDRFLGLPLHTSHRATLHPNVGKPIPLSPSLQRFPELITRIKASLYPRLLPGLRADFQTGKWLHFGAVSIQSQALRLQGRQIPWTQVKRITVQSGYLVVEVDQSQNRFLTSQILNLELLLELIDLGVKA